jgi:tRNA-Thr(GGU) m(6)t(6)A37 methyltransferase TsaA
MEKEVMSIEYKQIGVVKTKTIMTSRCWRTSDVEGELIIDKTYGKGIKGIQAGQYIFIIFHDNKSPEFEPKNIECSQAGNEKKFGVFSTHSSVRPNPIGMAFLEVLDVNDNIITIKGLDIENNTPILDIKPDACPWDSCPVDH